ncbi:MAG TPA: glycosyltransferase family 2 protein [Dictyobacter sp.]|jgi:glycosyltransferase involved in cell wall biosynthesis|nr:glycosyltransferase family 2 protein [Dictyobacter sp.]
MDAGRTGHQVEHSAIQVRARKADRPIGKTVGTRFSLSVVLPAYNEEAVIEQTVSYVATALANWTNDFEIIVVNDGSKDRTEEIIERLALSDPHICLLHHPTNKGYGAALMAGFQAATKELLFFMDSDGQFDIADLAQFFPLIERYDAVLGYRNPRCDPWPRKLNAWLWKQLVYLALGIQIRDLDCAFKLYHVCFLRSFQLETRGAMINAEMLYRLQQAGNTFAEVGVRHLERASGQATGANVAVIFKALHELAIFTVKWRIAAKVRAIVHHHMVVKVTR